MPTPATMRVVQMEPGPCPTLMAFAPQSARYSTPAALVTLPAMIGKSENSSRRSLTVSPTPLLWPCAVETATHALRLMGSGFQLAHGGGKLDTAGPVLGAHTDAVLRDIGYADADIAGLRERGVV